MDPLVSHVKITSSFGQRMWSSFAIVLVRLITSTNILHDVKVPFDSGFLVVGCSGLVVVGYSGLIMTESPTGCGEYTQYLMISLDMK